MNNQDYPLLYEQSVKGRYGVDLETPENNSNRTGQTARTIVGLPEVSEPQVIRHFVRISGANYNIDGNFYPLGSCTMKHNPRINEKLARLNGFANIHPLQPSSTVQGALALMFELQNWLATLTGLNGVTLVPSAGAHGELAGAKIIRKAHEEKGDARKFILIPDSAHGTNPATASMCGYSCKTVPSKNGLVDLDVLAEMLNEDVAAFMLTNPSTCGLFEPNMNEIADMVHAVGAYFYCDGANFNAIMGKVKPADLGVDVMQFNLHKTFSTPHGGGGPGSGPVAVCDALAKHLPLPQVKEENGIYSLITESEESIGRIRGFHGQFGMMVRALAYMHSHGCDGLKQISEDAVLSANYILANLKDLFNAPYDHQPCMHECLLTDKLQKENGITTHDIAKMLIDHNIHPMTVYFPLVVNGAMLIEPTESESKETIDTFIDVMRDIATEVSNGDKEALQTKYHAAPITAPRKRLDEVRAARQPVLTYQASIQE